MAPKPTAADRSAQRTTDDYTTVNGHRTEVLDAPRIRNLSHKARRAAAALDRGDDRIDRVCGGVHGPVLWLADDYTGTTDEVVPEGYTQRGVFVTGGSVAVRLRKEGGR